MSKFWAVTSPQIDLEFDRHHAQICVVIQRTGRYAQAMVGMNGFHVRYSIFTDGWVIALSLCISSFGPSQLSCEAATKVS